MTAAGRCQPQLVIVADDLTGALDSACFFAKSGLLTTLPLAGLDPGPCDVLTVTTESRDLPAADAAARVRETVRELAAASTPRWWYKKVDSALRGHPGEELAALLACLPPGPALVTPALPQEGRRVRDGLLYVHGEALADTALGKGRASSSIGDLFAAPGLPPAERLPLDAVRGAAEDLQAAMAAERRQVLLADAETNDDLRRLAGAYVSAGCRVACGSAGLARQLAPLLAMQPHQLPPPEARRRGRPVLVVAGSQHAATARQLERAERDVRLAIVRPEALGDEADERAIDRTAMEVRRLLQSGRHVALTTAGMPESPAGGRAVAATLAAIVAREGVREAADAMTLTGGDVAAAVCLALRFDRIHLRGEVMPLIPWGIAAGRGIATLPIATKAGSFGPDDTLTRCVRFLSAMR
ncbi:MAG: four-carbon acid sugar kinase family protein [Chloroflexota bacterium]